MADHELLQFFAFEHLPPHLRDVSEPFCVLAQDLAWAHAKSGPLFVTTAPGLITARMVAWEATPIANTEATWAGQKLSLARDSVTAPHLPAPLLLSVVLRWVLEAKDCAVRAVLYKPVSP